MTPTWRRMRAEDLPAVKRLSDAIYDPTLSESAAVYSEKLALYPAGCFVLATGGKTLGYLFSHPWRRDAPPKIDRALGALPGDADCYYVHDLALMPAARGHGAARAAMRLVRDAMALERFDVAQLVAVGDAASFWNRMGFVRIADADAGYGPGACLMEMRT